LALRAPLASEAGGLGLCSPPPFAGPDDPDYQAILAAVQRAAEEHRREKRFDMPGFRPNVYYIRTMQRYGVLPDDLPDDAALDPYATDQAYWRSFWYGSDGAKVGSVR
jgi:hypothetical protein